jgi:hypothetical protein
VVGLPHARLLRREQGRQPLPLLVGEFVSSHTIIVLDICRHALVHHTAKGNRAASVDYSEQRPWRAAL